ncbi:MAG: hypothetical protein Q9227_001293 [Pyrenula ochraceoflavens]
MSSLFLSLLAATCAFAAPSRRQSPFPDPHLCQSSSNDCRSIHDPSVVQRKSDGKYFRLSTFENIHISVADSLSGDWAHLGSALPDGSKLFGQLPDNQGIWAPDTYEVDDVWYMFYAVSTSGTRNSDIGVATSSCVDNPSHCLEPGTWQDLGSIGIPEPNEDTLNYNKIDPNLLDVDGRGSFLLSFGSYWGDIYQVSMQNPPTQVAGTPKQIEYNNTARPDGETPGPQEGSYQFRWSVNNVLYYYLFFDSGACCNTASSSDPNGLAPAGEEYKVMVCRSTSPTGPFTDDQDRDCVSQNGGKMVLGSHGSIYAPGGQGVMWDDQEQSVVMYYHYGSSTPRRISYPTNKPSEPEHWL